MITAASVWLKYDSKNEWLSPQLGEWCLWSMIINNKRNYFSGSLYHYNSVLYLKWDGYQSFIPDDTVYFARVNKINE